ncbi:MAG TPA: glycosyltransferase [Candidatus Nanoarchaeia archaeon]|nr:glycosyltransferase [Candidatus Nanoarchaeia archaeon]
MEILIIKTGALGDVLRTSFVAQALKDKYKSKNPEIYWIVDSSGVPLLANNPHIGKIIETKDKDSLSNKHFDLVINLEESVELCKFSSSLNSNEIIGFLFRDDKIIPSHSAKEWFNMSMLGKKPDNDILKKKNKKTHRQIISEIIGVKYGNQEPFLRLNEKQKNFTEDFLRRYKITKGDLIIGLNTGSSDRWPKELPIKKTVKLTEEIYKKFNAKILLFGGPQESERNKEIIRLSKAPIIDTGCGNDLFEFPALLSICSIIITTDSLGLHMALALKRKTICLVGPTSSAELDMYNLGEKIIADSNCLCCYKTSCKSMDKIKLSKIIKTLNKIVDQKITLLITAFKEPNIGKAIESAQLQKTNFQYKILISAPDEETLKIAESYKEKDKRISIFQDPGKGKSYALNMIFSKIKTDILILTDGDVFISKNSVNEICNLFLDPQVGCITGRPVPFESRDSKYGYWANFLFNAAHIIRKEAFENEKFIECSGYLFAFRKNKITEIPLDVAEDTVIPYYFWEKGYKIGYAEKAEVYVRNAMTWKDWVTQKTRTSKAHETLSKYVDISTTPRVKSFKNEFLQGISLMITYPNSFKEAFWTLELGLSRFYMWLRVFSDTKVKNKHYGDAWERIESTKSQTIKTISR